MIDGNFRILKHAMGIFVADAQFGNLAGAAGGGILVALAAGLRVIERAESVGEMLDLFERVLVRGVGGVVDQTVALVVEPSGSFGNWRRKREKTERQKKRNAGKQFHGDLAGGWLKRNVLLE